MVHVAAASQPLHLRPEVGVIPLGMMSVLQLLYNRCFLARDRVFHHSGSRQVVTEPKHVTGGISVSYLSVSWLEFCNIPILLQQNGAGWPLPPFMVGSTKPLFLFMDM